MGRPEGIIIGGGAAGLMAAITAAENGAGVTILEHMPRVGKKILSTGNGKCNLTNLDMRPDCYRCGTADFPHDGHRTVFCGRHSLFFRRLGVVVTDRNGYVYPASGQAQTVLDALREKAESLGVRIVTECRPETVERDGTGFCVRTSCGAFQGDFLILAAGSKAAPATGSDGSGYDLAASLGHKIVKPLPALVQLKCRGRFSQIHRRRPHRGRGEPLYGREAWGAGDLLASDRGELQLTDYGISGIPVFQVSRYASEALDRKKRVLAVLDFFPSLKDEELFSLLKEQRMYLSDRKAEGFLNGIFHKKLAALFLKAAGIRGEEMAGRLSDKKLLAAAELIKRTVVEVTAANSFDKAQVCMGGVRVKDVDPCTMESRLVPGLYFAGEILDVDGICGGYNLQWAWSSGYAAGASATGKE